MDFGGHHEISVVHAALPQRMSGCCDSKFQKSGMEAESEFIHGEE